MGLFRSEEYRFAMTKRKIGRKEKKRGIIESKKICLKKKGQIKKGKKLGKRRKESKGIKERKKERRKGIKERKNEREKE